MKHLLTFAFILIVPFMIFAKNREPNDLVKFLTGKWDNVSFEISDGRPVKKESYTETMVVKDPDSITITAHGFKDAFTLL